jgi:predicted nucleic acid-binding protein
MSAYFDSAIIVKLYVQEANSPDAVALVSAQPGPCPLTPWQEVEVRTAMRLKAFRGEVTAEELRKSMDAFDEDLRSGRWQMPAYEQGRIWQLTRELSARHAARIGCRTLDLIHVAAALAIGATVFVTFDARQKEVARLEGLNIKP